MEQTKYDVFISYSRKDYVDEHENVIPDNEVSKIMKALTDAGITYWIDKEGVNSGDKFTEELPKIIKSAPIFVFLSTANASKSKYTSKEIAIADEYGKYIIPVRIDMTPYSDKVIFRIADVSYINYYANPTKGREELVKSIKAFLEREKEKELQSKEEERLRKEELDRQRRMQEEEKKRQEKIAQIETEIAALEVQKTEREKTVLQKEQELKLAQIDLKACETKIQKLQRKLEELRNPSAVIEEKRLAEEKTFTVEGGESFKMIRVEGGSMGTFYIGETQVTQALWEVVMGNNPSRFRGENHPVERVNWNDICGKDGSGTDHNCFLYKLNQKTGKKFRLPKEAEWKYAAKGGKKSKNYTYAGSDIIDEVAWYEENSGGSTHPVKQKKANELGIYDMSGNVWEWCQDWYGKDYYSSSPQSNPQGPSSGSHRVNRGGSWNSSATGCRATCRYLSTPTSADDNLGFRLAL